MNLSTIIVSWTGPYSLEKVRESGKKNGIYLLVGQKKRHRTEEIKIQYCGITENYFYSRLTSKNHRVKEMREPTLSIWLGEIIYPSEFERWHLEVAEHCFVSFWQTPLNERKRMYYPSRPVCFISQWFTCDGEPRMRRPSIMTGKSDILWWDEKRWRTGKLRVWHEDE